MKVAAIVPAAGRGRRFRGKTPKLFVSLRGKPVLVHTLERLVRSFRFEEVLVMTASADIKKTEKLLKRFRLAGPWRVSVGGRTRAESVKRGFEQVSKKSDWVLIHDGARPCIGKALVLRTLTAAKATGAALCAMPATATVKKVDVRRGVVLGTEDRRSLYLAQTPQVFRKDLLSSRYRALGRKALEATDEAALFDGSRIAVRVIEGDARNIKVTTVEDGELLKQTLKKWPKI